MQASARPRIDLETDEPTEEQEDGRNTLPVWLWIVPVVLMLLFVVLFLRRHPATVVPPAAISGVNTLPELGVVQFDSGHPTLTPDGQATLDRAADAMHGNPNVHLRLEGYVSPTARPRSSDPLAVQRTTQVQLYLDGKGIERTRISGGRIPVRPAPSSLPVPGIDSSRAELYVE